MSQRQPLDELTAREREVLDLVRLGLTNEEIAARLGITEAGAKYHVSQILSKLGVSSREEAAAAVAPTPRGRWWAAVPLAAKVAGTAVVLAAVGGLGLLAWGVLRTSDESAAINRQPTRDDLPRMVLQPEDVPASMERRDNEDAGLGFQTRSEAGEKLSYQVEYEFPPVEADPGEIACIQSSVALFEGPEDASRGLADISGRLRTEGGDLWNEIGAPGLGDEGTGFEALSSEAVFCGSYEDERADVVLFAFRISNTLSVTGVVYIESGADPGPSFQYAQKQARRVDAVLGVLGPRIGDHWHAPYTFTACGEKQPNARVWESGVHTHGDGILHIHPFQAFEEGPGASLVKWFEYGGGLLTETEINMPGSSETYRNGDECPDGEPGELQVFVTRVGEASEERLEGDALTQYIPHDGDRIRIVFGAPEEPITYTPGPEDGEPTPRGGAPPTTVAPRP